jgi:lipopolysaccharide/colanic/teichoic acid biosynthesis glycosyltransferase
MKAESYIMSDFAFQTSEIYVDAEHRKVYYAVKELFGRVLSAIILVLTSPLLLLIAILIKLDSPGPILFAQTRVGAQRRRINGKLEWYRKDFRFYKFRTMIHNADPAIHKAYVQALIMNDEAKMAEIQQCQTPIRKLIKDPRITRVGRYLRKISLDELPQFYNVVRGEMSIIGPRPAIPYEVDVYQPWQLGRLHAKPGITGLQQVTVRCITSFDEQVRYDLEYIRRQSLLMDIQILIATPLAIFRTRGAH